MNRNSALALIAAAIFISAALCLDRSSASVTRPGIASTATTANTITVVNTNDSGPGSLRQAIIDAQNGETITFSIPPHSAVSLTSGELAINKNITVSGLGADLLTVSRAQGAADFRVFHVTASHSVTIEGLTISNGTAANFGQGGGIFVDAGATLSLVRSTVSGNSTGGTGAGVSSSGTLTVESSTVRDNNAGDYGGGVENNGTATINNSTVSGNNGEFAAGAILNGGSLTMTNSTISGNTTTLHGGGLANCCSETSRVVVNNCTFSGNSGSNGGAIYNRLGSLELESSILKSGSSGVNLNNDSATFTSLGFNISDDNGAGLLTATGDQINTDPMLGPLQNNGGPTLTQALLQGGPAINTGDPNFAPPPFFDQRGAGFDRVTTGRIDIGSFEMQGVPTPTPSPSPISVTVGTNPTGLLFSVDSTSYNATQTFNWLIGSSHNLSTSSPQNAGADTRYVWSNWNDGGAQAHDIVVTGTDTYTANFTTQYLLHMCCSNVTPPTGFFDAGQSVQINAFPPCGWSVYWMGSGNGSYTGSSFTATVVINGPITEDAVFEGPTCSPPPPPVPTPTPTPTPSPSPTSSPSGRTPFDFDGDGRADVSVFRPAEANWYLLRSRDGFAAANFGLPTDKIVPVDFDGDGKTDIAVYRPGNPGAWYWLNSTDGSFHAYAIGAGEFYVTPADYDGDGKADLAGFEPTSGNWFHKNSSNGQVVVANFGTAGDKPTVGDYDGDGRADIAVWRPSNGAWYRLNSSDGQFVAVSFGLSDDLTTPADFDGDGRTDIAVYRPSSGVWYWLSSSNGAFNAAQFGIAEDIPSAADFDGDGSADICVFRPSSGVWYRLNSSNGGFVANQFGMTGDLPTPAAFRY